MCNKSINEDLELNINFKYIYLRKKLFICFLMNALSPRNLPYILCKTVFKKSLSLKIVVNR